MGAKTWHFETEAGLLSLRELTQSHPPAGIAGRRISFQGFGLQQVGLFIIPYFNSK
jgi:hypothetical protein